MSDGNKRYLGDVFINSENYERQAQFFRDTIESYQYKYGGDFDAKTLQGMDASQFATVEQGEKSDRAILAPLYLGKSSLMNIDEPQYIYTDATLLDIEHEDLTQIPWFKNLSDDSLSEALYIIYQNVINKIGEEEFVPIRDAINEICEDVTDINGNTVKKVNASLINGLRLILITQNDYDNLDPVIKNYWRNVFIIRDQVPSDYYDPLSWDLTDGYRFEVNDNKLQVQSVLSGEYHDVCTLSELLEGMNFDAKIYNYITDSNNEYIIPSSNLANSIQGISKNTINENWERFPFLSSSLHDDFVESITIDNSTDYVETEIDESTHFKTVNLNISDIIADPLNDLMQTMDDASNDILQLESSIQTNEASISSLNSRMTEVQNKNTSQDDSINSILSKLNTINNNITNVNNQITNLNNSIVTWTRKDISGAIGTSQSFCWYNAKIGIAALYYNVYFYWNGSTSWGRRFKTTSTQVTERVFAKPFAPITVLTTDENVRVRITPENGDITLRITGGEKNIRRGIICTALYKYVGTN